MSKSSFSLKGLLRDKGMGLSFEIAAAENEISRTENKMKELADKFDSQYIALKFANKSLRWREVAGSYGPGERTVDRNNRAFITALDSELGRKMLDHVESESPRSLSYIYQYEAARVRLNAINEVNRYTLKRLLKIQELDALIDTFPLGDSENSIELATSLF